MDENEGNNRRAETKAMLFPMNIYWLHIQDLLSITFIPDTLLTSVHVLPSYCTLTQKVLHKWHSPVFMHEFIIQAEFVWMKRWKDT